VTGMETDTVTLQDIFVFEKRGVSPAGRVLGRFAATGILPKLNDKLVAAGMQLPTEIFDEVVEIGSGG
jgi:pilus assembly protein CpaF